MAKKTMQENNEDKYVLRLYVSGSTVMSNRTINNLRKICDNHFKDCYRLEVVDISKHPEIARKENIIACPTLIKKLPTPLRTLIGDMSDKEKVLVGLELFSEK